MSKHAYLILCHANFSVLQALISMIDDPRNDIYIHLDRKAGSCNLLRSMLSAQYSKIVFTRQISVAWGGYSMVESEMLLLEASVPGCYDYYHLLSGADLPLKTQDVIHDFFDRNQGLEFIGIGEESPDGSAFRERMGYYRFFQEHIGRSQGWQASVLWRLDRLSLNIQKKAKIDRLRDAAAVYKGHQWFSITHDFAEYVLSQRRRIRTRYRHTICADELFLQTLVMHSDFRDRLADTFPRHIDWKRGTPYTFTSSDYDELISTPDLFARKFDENTDFEIVARLRDHIRNRK